MSTLIKARAFLSQAPREALTDIAGLMAICALIFAGFTLPALL